MNKFVLGVLLMAGLGRTAFATAELELISGGTTLTFTDNQPGDANPTSGTITVFAQTVGGWTVSSSSDSSHSPDIVPFGINLNSVTAACSDSTCEANPLSIIFSDTDFTTPISNFATSFSATQTGPGSASQNAYVDTGNGLFATSSLIGTTLGPFTTPDGSGHTEGGGAAGPSNYSLTLVEIFTDPGNASVAFTNAGGQITGVPEPAAVVLFGTVLAVYATSLRRKRKPSLEK